MTTRKKPVRVTAELFDLGKAMIKARVPQKKVSEALNLSRATVSAIARFKSVEEYKAYFVAAQLKSKNGKEKSQNKTVTIPQDNGQGEQLGYRFLSEQISELRKDLEALKEKVNGAWYERVIGRR